MGIHFFLKLFSNFCRVNPLAILFIMKILDIHFLKAKVNSNFKVLHQFKIVLKYQIKLLYLEID